ncbi:MAG: helix-turn-helix domain-containing protein [Paenisporosarcina sp.]
MLFEQILLKMIDRLNGERTISAPFHLLRGKKSGQTIQDVKSYGLTDTFSIFPRLSKNKYKQTVEQLINLQLITLNQDKIPSLTQKGTAIKNKLATLAINGWLYRGNEMVFFQRLSLFIQTLSHVNAQAMNFIPIQKDEKIQKWVRRFISKVPYKTPEFANAVYQEIESCLYNAQLTEIHRQLIVYRLTGFHITGHTWQQLAYDLQEEPIDVQLRFIEALHILLNEIFAKPTYPILKSLAHEVRALNPLTDSASKTAQLYAAGKSLHDISTIRQLKQSTIEDHFVEMVMNGVWIEWTSFFPNNDIEELNRLIKTTSTHKLSILKEQFPYLSFFQLRLLLASRGVNNDD